METCVMKMEPLDRAILNLEQTAPPQDMARIDPGSIEPRMIAPCGMNCALCLAFQRPKRRCPGCRAEGAYRSKSCRSCIIHNCEIIKTGPSHFCYECEKLPCRRLKQLDARYRAKYGMSMIANLTEIRDRGMETFLAHQAKKYTCPTCHGLLCVHRSRCLTCDP